MTHSRAVAAVLVLSLVATPAWADHVPSRRATPKPGADRVSGRLVELGMSPQAAKTEVASLTPAEVSYFSGDLSRVQVAGAAQDMFSGSSDNLWFESLAGMGFFGVGLIIVFVMLSHNE